MNEVKQELKEIYEELVEEVETEEDRIEDDLLDNSRSFGVNELLERPPNTWSSGKKSLRSEAVVPVYESFLDDELPREVKKSLVGFDAYINSLDDIIDTDELDEMEKVELTANTAFSGMMAFFNTDNSSGVDEMTINYLSELFQIPMVEQRAINNMRDTDNKEEVLNAAANSYEYRSRDMDWFARLPKQEVGSENENIVEDLRDYRAIELLVKDLYDIPRDLEDNQVTPAMLIMSKFSQEESIELIETLYDRLDYDVDDNYVDVLDSFKPEKSEIDKLVGEFYEKL